MSAAPSDSSVAPPLPPELVALAHTRGRRPWTDLRAPALVVVDVQRLFCDPHSPAALADWPACVPRLQMLVRAFSAARRPVIFSRHLHAVDDTGGLPGRFFDRLLRQGDPLGALDPALASLWQGHPVVDKDRHSVFSAPSLRPLLVGCDALVLAGVQTPLCILASAVDCGAHALVPVIAVDACAARSTTDHLAALRTLAAGHAHLASVDELARTWGAPA